MSKMNVVLRYQNVEVAGRHMYVAHPTYGGNIGTEDIIRMAAADSQMSEAVIAGAFYAIEKQFREMLLNGHCLKLGALGCFRMSFSCRAGDAASDVDAESVYRRRIIYTPSVMLKDAMSKVEFSVSLPAASGGE